MWTLSDLKTRLGERLAETGTTFWGDTERTSVLNEAQRLIAAITKGVPQTVTGTVNTTTPHVALPAQALDIHSDGSFITGGNALRAVPKELLDRIDPRWRRRTGEEAIWIAVDTAAQRVYVVPQPTTSKTLNVVVAVLPDDMALDSDKPFDGHGPMEKYQGAIVQYATVLSLLKERYDQDAERFYGFFQREMQNLGVNPADIPPMPTPLTTGEAE
jgi:hypothetical protein